MRQSLASSTAARGSWEAYFSSLPSNRSKRVMASAVAPGKPGQDPALVHPADLDRAGLDHRLSGRDLAVSGQHHGVSLAHGKDRGRSYLAQFVNPCSGGEPGHRPASAGRLKDGCIFGWWRARRGPASPARPADRPRRPAGGWRRSGAVRGAICAARRPSRASILSRMLRTERSLRRPPRLLRKRAFCPLLARVDSHSPR